MNTCYIPQGYRTPLTGYDMQRAIEFEIGRASCRERV